MKITIDTSKIIADNRSKSVGININYLRDADANRTGKPLHEALTDMGVKRLRYPGGEKSNRHFFAKPPYELCEPAASGYYAERMKESAVMDFDMFIDLVRKIEAEPHVNVAFHHSEKTGVPIETYIEHAAAWVRYANIKKGYGVKYWEIGNENWLDKYPPEETAYYIKDFSQAMKRADPSIKICASGCNSEWWEKFLPIAKPYVDVLTVSDYCASGWGNYDHYANQNSLPLIGQAETAIKAIDQYAPEYADNMEVVISELNSMDYSENGWAPSNNLGHSLVTFDQFGKLLTNSHVSYGMLWNTRWMNQNEQYEKIWYGLDEHNEPLPSGMAVKLWGKFLRDTFLQAEDEGNLTVYSCKDQTGLSVYILNKYPTEAVREIVADGSAININSAYVYSGESPDDIYPVLREYTKYTANQIICKPYSVTVLLVRFDFFR